MYIWRFPLLFTSLCWFPFVPLSVSFYLLGTLLAVTGSVHPVPRLLANWSPHLHPSPFPPHSEIPTPWGFPEPNAPPYQDDIATLARKSSTIVMDFFLVIHVRKCGKISQIFFILTSANKNVLCILSWISVTATLFEVCNFNSRGIKKV